ncbi:unnamed protein product [Callosobruchus maculatus]|uniref:Uncharacterized protein n=1 Tax=Callosobruchus maculatus TaxID=64391 RepID=A0A653CR05_CALMS|nr:unnamed protein product [Callosobruchus maculatus]
MEYLLVRFIGDDILHIVPTKKVSTINEELVHAPYKRMGYYEARPIEYSDDKNYLEKKKEVLEEQASEDNRNEEHHEDSDDSVKDPDYEPEEGRTEIYKAKSLLQESSAEAKNIQPIQHIAVKHVSGNPDMDYKELELFDTECGRSSSRKSWSQKEKEEVDKAFKFYLENYEIPPFQNCCEIIQNSDVLSDRTPEQLRAFVANHIAKHKKQLYTPDSEKCRKGNLSDNTRLSISNFIIISVVRKRWTEEEKREVYRIFGDVMQKKIYHQ